MLFGYSFDGFVLDSLYGDYWRGVSVENVAFCCFFARNLNIGLIAMQFLLSLEMGLFWFLFIEISEMGIIV